MIIAIPYRTDAAIDHRPYATAGLILANLAVVFAFGFVPDSSDVAAWGIQGGKFRPWTWITASFLHFDWLHVIGNMIFLWTFGLIVEGYAGPLRYLGAYLAISFVGGGVMQILMLGHDGGASAGASLPIYGLLSMAALWAPRNRLDAWLSILIVIVRRIEPTVWTFCLAWIGLDVVVQLFRGFTLGSATAHLLGAGAGAWLAVQFLRRGWVHCEGWDWFSLRTQGRPKGRAIDYSAGPGPAPESDEAALPAPSAAAELAAALDLGDAGTVERILRTRKELQRGATLARAEFVRAVSILAASPDQVAPSVTWLRRYLELHADDAAEFRLVLAGRLLDAGRPRDALEEIAVLQDDSLTEQQQSRREVLSARARIAAPPSSGLELE